MIKALEELGFKQLKNHLKVHSHVFKYGASRSMYKAWISILKDTKKFIVYAVCEDYGLINDSLNLGDDVHKKVRSILNDHGYELITRKEALSHLEGKE